MYNINSITNTSEIAFKYIIQGFVLLILVDALEIPSWLLLILNLPVPWLGNCFPYFAPFVIAILLFSIFIKCRVFDWHLYLLPSTILFSLFIIFITFLEVIHWIASGEQLNTWLIFSFSSMFFYFIGLNSFCHLIKGYRDYVVKKTLFLIVTLALVDFVLSVLISSRGHAPVLINGNQLFDSAYIAYICVFGIAIVLFEKTTATFREGVTDYAFIIPFLLLVIYQQRLTGPLLIFLMLIGIKGLSFMPRKYLTKAFVFLFFLVAAILINAVLKSGHEHNPTFYGFNNYVYYFDEYAHIHGDVISTYIRKESILQALELLLSNSVFGIGMNAASQVKVLGHGIHSSLIYIFLAYGISGFILFSGWLFSSFVISIKLRGIASIALPATLISLMILSPTLMLWWSILLFLVVNPVQDERSKIENMTGPNG